MMIAMPDLDARRLVLRNNLAELDRLAGWIEGWAQQDLSPDLSFAVQLCLEEAVANIIMHSVANGRLEIAVEVERKDQTLVARIEDNGSAFDPTQVPPPPVPASLDEAKVGDIGIHLMRSFASGIHYERRDGTNRLTMRFAQKHSGSRGLRKTPTINLNAQARGRLPPARRSQNAPLLHGSAMFSEQFRSAHRTRRSPCGRLRVRQTGCGGKAP